MSRSLISARNCHAERSSISAKGAPCWSTSPCSKFEVLGHDHAIDGRAERGAIDIRLDLLCLLIEDLYLEHGDLRARLVAAGADPVGISGVAELFLLRAIEFKLEAAGIQARDFLAPW